LLSQGSLSDVVRVPSFLRSGAFVVFEGALDVFEALFSDSVMLVSQRLIGLVCLRRRTRVNTKDGSLRAHVKFADRVVKGLELEVDLEGEMKNEYETTSFDCFQVSASRAAEAEDVEGVEEAGRCNDETKDGRLEGVEGVEAVSCECDNMEVRLALFTCLMHLDLGSLFPSLHTKGAGDLRGKSDTHPRYSKSNQRQS